MESLSKVPVQLFTMFTRADSEKNRMKSNGFITCLRFNEESRFGLVKTTGSVRITCITTTQKRCGYVASPACKKRTQVTALKNENGFASPDDIKYLQKRAEDVAPHLRGRCIFLVGMMGSGKTTVGRVLSDALGYSFADSDDYVEAALGKSVAQIFQECGESGFRDYESEALSKLCRVPRLVVATGGGAAIRPLNWEHMKQGVSVYLEAPIDALARRIASAGTSSRPLLHRQSGDPYVTAFIRLFTLSKKRAEGYSAADITVSLQDIALKVCLEDVRDITPATIAIEVLDRMEMYLKSRGAGKCIQTLP